MKKVILSFCSILALASVSSANCPELAGKYACPGFMTIKPFTLEIVQDKGEGFTQYNLNMTGGYVGTASTKASPSGFQNEDGALSACIQEKVSVKTSVETLGVIEGQVYKGIGDTVRVMLIGATPEPWEALVCKRL